MKSVGIDVAVYLFIAFVAAVFAAVLGRQWLIRRRAKSWAEVTGSIDSETVYDIYEAGSHNPPIRRSTDRFYAELAYSYRVEGQHYGGLSGQWFPDERAVSDFVNSSKGKQALVRYNPGNPAESVIWKVMDEVHHARQSV